MRLAFQLTGCPQIGPEPQTNKVDSYQKNVDRTSSFWSSFGASGIPLLIPDQPTVQTASGSVRKPHSTNLGAVGQFFVATQGAGGGGVARAMAPYTP